ncbi:MAG: hypothetical protein AB7K04_07190 [Pseudorhodoplanes sp.]
MRRLLAILAVLAILPVAAATAAPLKLPHLVKTDDPVCERKPDGVYCGRGIKKKQLFRCVGGEIAATYVCDFGCDQKTKTCAVRRPRGKAVEKVMAPRTDCHYTTEVRRGAQASADCK